MLFKEEVHTRTSVAVRLFLFPQRSFWTGIKVSIVLYVMGMSDNWQTVLLCPVYFTLSDSSVLSSTFWQSC